MNDTREIRDPFLNKTVEISDKLTDRLRGKYACGPTLPNGEPEFGWNQFETPSIQHVAAAEIERLQKLLSAASGYLMNAKIDLETNATKRTAIRTIEGGIKMIEAALTSKPTGA
jgi:hypothetical protein